jgi:predicted DCC family thiol-disulfide oxidoreductase YuxK
MSNDNKATVIFDGQCPLCRRSVRILGKLDWLGRLRYHDAHDVAHLPQCAAPLDPQRLLEEMHVVPADGRTAYAGFRAFRFMAWRLPATMLFAPLLYLPGVPWLGHRVYLWVAKNRLNLVPCHDGQCKVPLRRT